jgi:hypothetical protein
VSGFLEFLDIVIWPAVAIAGIGFLASGKGSRMAEAIFRNTRRIKALGVEFEFGGEDDARRVKAGFEEALGSYREDVETEFDRQVKRFDLARLLAVVAEEVVEPAVCPRYNHYRCTVYVEDIVFKNVLYRLLDYYPGGNGKGSIYSSRFGIIGRSWRLGKSEGPTEVPDGREELITTWGMTREEAASQHTAKWYMTFLLETDGHEPPVGMLYLEAEKDVPASLADDLAAADSVRSLSKAVGLLMDNLREKGPYLELFDR